MFDIKKDMERTWNVIKFTCGLMADSSELIECVCKVFAESKMSTEESNTFYSVYDHNYLNDLKREKSSQSVDPFNNSEICCMNNSKSELGNNCSLYYFYGTNEYIKYTKIQTDQPHCRQSTKPCGIVVINEAISTSFMRTTSDACSLISQPIKCIQIHGHSNYKNSLFSNEPLGEGLYYDSDSDMEQDPLFPIVPVKPLVQIRRFSRFQNNTTFLNFCPGATASFINCDLGRKNLKLFTDSLKNSTALSKLFLHNCEKVPETFFSLLANKRNLIHLQVTFRWSFQDTCLNLATELRHLINLEVLALKGVFLQQNSIAMKFMHSMTTLRGLRVLSLKRCHLLPPTVIELMKILTNCPLEELHLSHNNLLGVFHELSLLTDHSYQFLKRIEIRGAVLSKGDILGLARFIEDHRLPLIEKIDMQGNDLLKKQDALKNLAKTCEYLFKTRPCSVVVCADELEQELRERRYSCLQATNHGI